MGQSLPHPPGDHKRENNEPGTVPELSRESRRWSGVSGVFADRTEVFLAFSAEGWDGHGWMTGHSVRDDRTSRTKSRGPFKIRTSSSHHRVSTARSGSLIILLWFTSVMAKHACPAVEKTKPRSTSCLHNRRDNSRSLGAPH